MHMENMCGEVEENILQKIYPSTGFHYQKFMIFLGGEKSHRRRGKYSSENLAIDWFSLLKFMIFLGGEEKMLER